MKADVRETYLLTDVGRLGRTSPYYRAVFLSLRKLPVPHIWNSCSAEDRAVAVASLTANQGGADLSEAQKQILLFLRLSESLKQVRYDEAVACASALAALQPRDFVIRFVLGYAHFGAKNFGSCLSEMKESLELNPESELAQAAVLFLCALAWDHHTVRELQGVLQHAKAIKKYWAIGDLLHFAVFQAEILLDPKDRIGTHLGKGARAKNVAAWLPDFVEILPWGGGQAKEAFFVLTDSTYFKKFAALLILSAIDRGVRQAFHVHIINPDEESLNLAAVLRNLMNGRLRLTTEQVDPERYCHPRVYYCCVRYCRFHQFFADGNTDYLIIDADMLINRPFEFEELRREASAGCALLAVPDQPIWNSLAGGFGLYTRDDAGSNAILEGASWFIMDQVKSHRGAWSLDQLALFISTSVSSVSWGALNYQMFCDESHNDDSLVWAVTNDKDMPRFTHEQGRLRALYLGS